MRKITNEELNRPSAGEFAAMEKMPVAAALDKAFVNQPVDQRRDVGLGAAQPFADFGNGERSVLPQHGEHPPNRDIHKTALGAELTVPWTYHKTTEECIARLRAEGYRVYAVEQVEGAVMLGDFRAEPGVKYALVFGNEVMGVGQQAVDMCHGAIEIPQAGTKHSINVSVSGGVVLWDFFCQIRPKR